MLQDLKKHFGFWCLALSLGVSAFIPVSFASSTAVSESKVSDDSHDSKLSALNCAIVHKEIELEKSNAHFLLTAHPEGRWKAWRYFAFQEAGGAAIESGLITGISDRFRQIDHGGKIRGVLVEDSLAQQMIGQFVAAAGDVVELSLNARLALRAKRLGQDCGTRKRIAVKLHKELLDLLKKRESLIENTPELANSMSTLETNILRDQERLSWLQYSRSLSNARKMASTENTFYALDTLKNLTGAAGNIVGIAATNRLHPRLNIPANALTTLSGLLLMSNPVTSRLTGRLVARVHSAELDQRFKQELSQTVSSLTKNSEALTEIYRRQNQENGTFNRLLSARVNLYSRQAERAGTFVLEQKAKDRRANTGALNTMAVAAFTGATKVANGVCGIVAADGLSPRAGASVLLGGATAYAVGTDVGLIDNARINIVRERRFQHQRQTATSANDVLIREIEDLDKLDAELKDTETSYLLRPF